MSWYEEQRLYFDQKTKIGLLIFTFAGPLCAIINLQLLPIALLLPLPLLAYRLTVNTRGFGARHSLYRMTLLIFSASLISAILLWSWWALLWPVAVALFLKLFFESLRFLLPAYNQGFERLLETAALHIAASGDPDDLHLAFRALRLATRLSLHYHGNFAANHGSLIDSLALIYQSLPPDSEVKVTLETQADEELQRLLSRDPNFSRSDFLELTDHQQYPEPILQRGEFILLLLFGTTSLVTLTLALDWTLLSLLAIPFVLLFWLVTSNSFPEIWLAMAAPIFHSAAEAELNAISASALRSDLDQSELWKLLQSAISPPRLRAWTDFDRERIARISAITRDNLGSALTSQQRQDLQILESVLYEDWDTPPPSLRVLTSLLLRLTGMACEDQLDLSVQRINAAFSLSKDLPALKRNDSLQFVQGEEVLRQAAARCFLPRFHRLRTNSIPRHSIIIESASFQLKMRRQDSPFFGPLLDAFYPHSSEVSTALISLFLILLGLKLSSLLLWSLSLSWAWLGLLPILFGLWLAGHCITKTLCALAERDQSAAAALLLFEGLLDANHDERWRYLTKANDFPNLCPLSRQRSRHILQLATLIERSTHKPLSQGKGAELVDIARAQIEDRTIDAHNPPSEYFAAFHRSLDALATTHGLPDPQRTRAELISSDDDCLGANLRAYWQKAWTEANLPPKLRPRRDIEEVVNELTIRLYEAHSQPGSRIDNLELHRILGKIRSRLKPSGLSHIGSLSKAIEALAQAALRWGHPIEALSCRLVILFFDWNWNQLQNLSPLRNIIETAFLWRIFGAYQHLEALQRCARLPLQQLLNTPFSPHGLESIELLDRLAQCTFALGYSDELLHTLIQHSMTALAPDNSKHSELCNRLGRTQGYHFLARAQRCQDRAALSLAREAFAPREGEKITLEALLSAHGGALCDYLSAPAEQADLAKNRVLESLDAVLIELRRSQPAGTAPSQWLPEHSALLNRMALLRSEPQESEDLHRQAAAFLSAGEPYASLEVLQHRHCALLLALRDDRPELEERLDKALEGDAALLAALLARSSADFRIQVFSNLKPRLGFQIAAHLKLAAQAHGDSRLAAQWLIRAFELSLRRKGLLEESLCADWTTETQDPNSWEDIRHYVDLQNALNSEPAEAQGSLEAELQARRLRRWAEQARDIEVDFARPGRQRLDSEWRSASFEALHGFIPKGGAIVDFALTRRVYDSAHPPIDSLPSDSVLVAFVLRPEWTSPQLVELGPESEVNHLIDEYRDALRREAKPGLSEDLKIAEKNLHERIWSPLSKVLPAPALNNAEPAPALILIPIGGLFNLPFAALPLDSQGQKRVLEGYELRFEITARRLLRPQEPVQYRAPLILDPEAPLVLAEAKEAKSGQRGAKKKNAKNKQSKQKTDKTRESQRIYEECHSDLGWRVLSGTTATKAQLAELESPLLIHVKAPLESIEHPVLYSILNESPENPIQRAAIELHSGLENRPGDAPPGRTRIRLGAYELSTLNWEGSELAFFSAGAPLPLRAASYCAGARALVFSHWDGEPEVHCDLIVDFYRRLLSGKGRAAALREAQLTVYHSQGARSHPFYWAGYQCEGEGGPLPNGLDRA